MNSRVEAISLIIVIVAVCFVISACGSPTPTSVNTTPIDAEEGYIVGDVAEGEVIPAEAGVLEGVVPMTDFECSGRVYQIKKDNQDGFSHSLTLVFGRLAEPAIFEYLTDSGAMNKKFDDGFVLNTNYFRSHVAAFYVHAATDNLEKAVTALKVGNPVRIEGSFVYLKTKNKLVKTSLNPSQFKCKYIYLTEVATDESIYN